MSMPEMAPPLQVPRLSPPKGPRWRRRTTFSFPSIHFWWDHTGEESMHPELVGLRPATQSLESPGPGNLLVGLVDEVLQSICMHLARAYRAI
eukprot:5522119-Prorocentrum_lima.AAC.1